jgi:hypothetical protein
MFTVRIRDRRPWVGAVVILATVLVVVASIVPILASRCRRVDAEALFELAVHDLAVATGSMRVLDIVLGDVVLSSLGEGDREHSSVRSEMQITCKNHIWRPPGLTANRWCPALYPRCQITSSSSHPLPEKD